MSDDLASPLSKRLRERTAASHERIESVLDVLNDRLTLDRYAALLERWYGFEATWERVAPAALNPSLSQSPIDLSSFLESRRRLPMLKNDLLACGRSVESIDMLPTVPADALPWSERSTALGVLYVIEGSTLGGQHVAKFIRQHLGLTPEHGIQYFSSYGPNVGVRWRETKALLDAPPFQIDEEKTIAVAIATFDYLATWLTTKE